MTPADRIAFRDRVARALAWDGLVESQRADYNRRAAAVIDELFLARDQQNRIGWMLIDPSEVEEEEAEA